MPLPLIPIIMGGFSFFKNSWLGRVLAIAGGAMLAVLLVFSAGKRSQRKKQETANLREHIDVRKKADKAADETARDLDGIDDADLDERLRKHGALRDRSGL